MKNKEFRLIGLFLVLATALLINCDPFKEDIIPADKEVVFNPGQTIYYILPNSSAIIDLKSIVQTSFVNLSLNTTINPERGDLSKIGEFILKYQPHPDFLEGQDRFAYSVNSSNGRILKSDTVYIMMSQDTTAFPCHIYAVEDFTSIKPGESVSIPFLDNDRICGAEKEALHKSIYSQPQHGSAMLTNNIISYAANPGYEGWDQFVYKISTEIGDSVMTSFGLISILVDEMPCNFILNDDYLHYLVYENAGDNSIPASFEFNILENDIICSLDSSTFVGSILEGPFKGRAWVIDNGKIRYEKSHPITQNFVDSLVYQLCYKGICKQATVRFDFEVSKQPCCLGLDIQVSTNEDVAMCFTVFKVGDYSYDGGDGKYGILYDVVNYYGSPRPIDFTVSITPIESTVNGKTDKVTFTGHDTEDLFDGPKPTQYFEKADGNFFNFTDIQPDASHEPIDLTIDLTWDAGDSTTGNYNYDLYLWHFKDCSEVFFNPGPGETRIIGTSAQPEDIFESISVDLTADDYYGIQLVSEVGLPEGATLTITLSTKDGKLDNSVYGPPGLGWVKGTEKKMWRTYTNTYGEPPPRFGSVGGLIVKRGNTLFLMGF